MSNIQDIINLLNPWWQDNEVSQDLAKSYKREIINKVKEVQSYRQIIIISGLRRVGKTTLLYQTIKDLLIKSESKRVFYFNFDKEVKSLVELFEDYQHLTGINYKKEKISVFFDEITKLHKWASELKLIYDSHPNIKFYISSSSSINLEDEAIKNLAGRYFLININPLSFKEFLELSNKQKFLQSPNLFEKELKKDFFSYLLRSFPETVDWGNALIVKDYLKTTIIDKIIKLDIPERFDNINKGLLFSLLELFYKEPGYYLDYDSLSKNLRISKSTLYDHIYYLEFCYLIRIARNFRPNTLSTSRKLQRVYPYWWTLAFCYEVNEDKIVENLVLSIIDGKYYWRDLEKEIDFLKIEKKSILPIEVKNKEKIEKRDLKNLIFFMDKYNIKNSLLIYLGKEEIRKFGDKTVRLVSFWKFLLEN